MTTNNGGAMSFFPGMVTPSKETKQWLVSKNLHGECVVVEILTDGTPSGHFSVTATPADLIRDLAAKLVGDGFAKVVMFPVDIYLCGNMTSWFSYWHELCAAVNRPRGKQSLGQKLAIARFEFLVGWNWSASGCFASRFLTRLNGTAPWTLTELATNLDAQRLAKYG